MAGTLVHFEFPADDAGRARGFWSGLFGWKFRDAGIPGMDYQLVQTGPGQGGAVYPSDGGRRGPIVYFDTDDIDASIAKVRELGGNAADKQPIPHVGWFAPCSDTEGNEFSLFQSDESAQMPS
jgi:predicted enzyme related to lactoylglutathione lyase